MFNPQSIVTAIISLVLLTVTVQLVRRRRLREEYALPWLGANAAILVLSVFPLAVRALGVAFDVGDAPPLVLVLGMLFALAILLSHSVIVTTLADHRRDLAQSVSILEWQVRQLETKVTSVMDGREVSAPGTHANGTGDP